MSEIQRITRLSKVLRKHFPNLTTMLILEVIADLIEAWENPTED